MLYERSNMEVRKMQGDFSQAEINWLPSTPEMAQFWNAMGIGLPLLESFLVQTMKKAAELLPPEEETKRLNCDMFCAQETHHYQSHRRFNNKVRDTGFYPRTNEFLDELRDDYRRFTEKGTRYCMHYVEGFETNGPIMAGYFLTEINKHLKNDAGIDLVTASLWCWHVSEEFEHRCVAFDAVETLYGSYRERLAGIFIAGFHLVSFCVRLSNYMIEEDYKAGRIKRGPRSTLRKARGLAGLLFYAAPRMLKALSPFYNPIRLKAPKGAWKVLEIASETLSINEMAKQPGRIGQALSEPYSIPVPA